ncbi:MAG: hypothetical protein OEX81_02325 [Candidatus Pacebacteria bacterium]|nr:hypothetical protein [Candidatus Paceibacterota bacterium]
MAFEKEPCEEALRARKEDIIASAVDHAVAGSGKIQNESFGGILDAESSGLRHVIADMIRTLFDYDFAIMISTSVFEFEDLLISEWLEEVQERVSKMTFSDVVESYARLNDKEVVIDEDELRRHEKYLDDKQMFERLLLPILLALVNNYFGEGSSVKMSDFNPNDDQYFIEVEFPYEQEKASIRYTLYKGSSDKLDADSFVHSSCTLNGERAFGCERTFDLNEETLFVEVRDHLFNWVLNGDMDLALRVAKQS